MLNQRLHYLTGMLIVTILVVNVIYAGTIYVNGICGDDSRTGTNSDCIDPNGPKATIQAGIDVASSGDTIIVAPGTYFENIRMNDGISLLGAGAEVTTINGGGNGHVVVFNLASGAISGFKITNSGDNPLYSAGIFLSQCTVAIEHNIVVNNRYGIMISSYSNGYVMGNRIVDNSGAAIKVSFSYGMIVNNVICDNYRQGIYCYHSSPTIASSCCGKIFV